MRRVLSLVAAVACGVVCVFGQETVSEDGQWSYLDKGDGTVGILGYLGGYWQVTVPETVDGKTVVSIDRPGAFLYLGDEVREVALPSTLKFVAAMAFLGVTDLISAPSDSEAFTTNWGALYSKDRRTLYAVPTAVELPSFPPELREIAAGAFVGNTALREVTIPASVTSVGAGAFANTAALGTVTIPATGVHVEPNAFSGSAARIVVEAGNANYASLDGLFCDKALTTLYHVPSGYEGALAIPEGFTTLGQGALGGNVALSELIFPSTFTTCQFGYEPWNAPSLRTIRFLGPPPTDWVDEGPMRFDGGWQCAEDVRGYYSSAHAEAWAEALAEDGTWRGLPMEPMPTDVDFAGVSAEVPASGVVGQAATFAWTLANVGKETIDGTWRDAVSLVDDAGEEVSLGVAQVSGTLGPGGTLRVERAFSLPPMGEGAWRLKVVANAWRDVFEDARSGDNVLTSAASFPVSVPAATPGAEGWSGALGADGMLTQRFDLAGADGLLRLTVPAGATVRWGFGAVPAEGAAMGTGSGPECLVAIPEGGGTLYVVVEGGKAGDPCAATVEPMPLALVAATPRRLPNAGEATLLLSGAGLPEGVSLGLEPAAPGAIRAVERLSGEALAVTLDCSLLEPGRAYAVRVAAEAETATLPNAFSVARALLPGKLWAELDIPTAVRPGRVYECVLRYGNSGEQPIPAPVLQVSLAGGGSLAYDGGAAGLGLLQFVGAGTAPLAGTLLPGAERRLAFRYVSSVFDTLTLSTSEDKDFNPAPWPDAGAYLADLSAAATRVALRGQDATAFDAVFALAQRTAFGEPGQRVRGRVLAPSGAPVPWVALTATDAAGNVETFATDAAGAFLSPDLAPGRWEIAAEGAKAPVAVDLAPGVDALGVTLRLAELRTLDVTLADAAGGPYAPAEALAVSARHTDASEAVRTYRAVPTDAGAWRLTNLPAGGYALTANDGVCVGGGFARAGEGGDRAVTVVMEPFGTLAGRIDLTGLSVPAVLAVGEGAVFFAEADPSGAFAFEAVPAGEYALTALDQAGAAVALGVATVAAGEETVWAPAAQARVAARAARSAGSVPDRMWFWEVRDEAKALAARARALAASKRVGEPAYDCAENRARHERNLRNRRKFLLSLADYEFALERYTRTSGGDVTKLAARLFAEMLDAKSALRGGPNDLCDKAVKASEEIVDLGVLVADTPAFARARLGDIWETFRAIKADFAQCVDGAERLVLAYNEQSFSEFTFNVGNLNELLDTAEAIQNLLDRIDDLTDRVEDFHKDGMFGLLGDTFGKNIIEFQDGLAKMRKAGYALKRGFARFAGFVPQLLDLTLAMRAYTEGYLSYFNDTDRLREQAWAFQRVCDAYAALDFSYVGPEDLPQTFYRPALSVREPVVPQSWDPNEMGGPAGVGAERKVKPGQWLTYTVYFENKPEATGAAQEVRVTHALDADLDWETFELLDVAYRNQTEPGLSGKAAGAATSPLAGTPYQVRTEASFDPATGQAGWYLRIVDETTPDKWPADAYAGILPPNNAAHEGEGHVTYRVRVREDADDGARIDASAIIVFDLNAPIATDPAWWNTVAHTIDGARFEHAALEAQGPEGKVTVTVQGGSAEAATAVDLRVVGGTMRLGEDLASPDTRLEWARGDTAPKTLAVAFDPAALALGDKTLLLGLENADGLALDEAGRTCAVTIRRHVPALVWPEGAEPSEALAAWVTEGAARALVADGPLTLAPGVTAETLERARAFGVYPAFAASEAGGAEADVRVALRVGAIEPAGEALHVSARVVAEVGAIADPYAPEATFGLRGGASLDEGTWGEIAPDAVGEAWRRSAGEAEIPLRFVGMPASGAFFRLFAR